MELGSLCIFKMGQEYLDELKKAMDWFGEKEDTFFLGQTVVYPGSPMNASLKDVPQEKKLEMPVEEDMQMGISIGLALEGFVPISVYPRIDFLIIAMNQLVNHLDKIAEMSKGEFKPGVIIRTQIGNTEPIWPGLQHCGDYTEGLQKMCKNIRIWKLEDKEDITSAYKATYILAKKGISTIIIETPQGGSEKSFHKVDVKGGSK